MPVHWTQLLYTDLLILQFVLIMPIQSGLCVKLNLTFCTFTMVILDFFIVFPVILCILCCIIGVINMCKQL